MPLSLCDDKVSMQQVLFQLVQNFSLSGSLIGCAVSQRHCLIDGVVAECFGLAAAPL